MSKLIDISKEFAITKHKEVNHTYSVKGVELPYDYHLTMVYETALRWSHILSEKEREWVLSVAWLHDVIEDCRVNYNDLVTLLGFTDDAIRISDIVYNVTNELGKSRKERAMKTYPKIASCIYSVFVKCADRYANTLHSKEEHEFNPKNTMYSKYKQEYRYFKNSLKNTIRYDFSEIWKEIDEI
jgi:(p)ppGpp synthase/HD superfamily hydrolase